MMVVVVMVAIDLGRLTSHKHRVLEFLPEC